MDTTIVEIVFKLLECILDNKIASPHAFTQSQKVFLEIKKGI